VLGDECYVGEHAVLNPGVKVYPFKTVEANAVVNSSIVWESRGARHLFGRLGVCGLANIDITPELAVRVAMAYATTLKKGSTVTTSRDSSRAARALKRAVMAGLNAAGVNVEDLEVAPVPVTRYQVRSETSQGGVTVRLLPDDPQSVMIRFFDTDGTDISEATQRKIERLFHREDFRRAFAGDIGDIGFPPRAAEYYSAALMATVDADAIRAAGFKTVIDYAYGTTSFVMPNVLSKLGADVLTVNPYASTSGAATVDVKAHAEQVANLVRTAGANLGAVIDPDGEHIVIVDDEGHVLSNDEALFALLTLVGATTENARVALPVSVSRHAETLAANAGIDIAWTKLSTPHLMDVSREPGVVLAASQEGGFIFPDFLPAYDATATFVHLLELLARTGLKLSKIVAGLPRIHVFHESVVTPWEQKGMVMRTLVERIKDRELVLVDGVKVIYDDGWALVLPDPEEPVTHVWAEAGSDGDARNRAQEYARRIRQMLR
jgi:mannose-1-phosphate guanylyltransferase/phosphomannomutase